MSIFTPLSTPYFVASNCALCVAFLNPELELTPTQNSEHLTQDDTSHITHHTHSFTLHTHSFTLHFTAPLDSGENRNTEYGYTGIRVYGQTGIRATV